MIGRLLCRLGRHNYRYAYMVGWRSTYTCSRCHKMRLDPMFREPRMRRVWRKIRRRKSGLELFIQAQIDNAGRLDRSTLGQTHGVHHDTVWVDEVAQLPEKDSD